MIADIDSFPQPNEAFVWVQASDEPALLCRPLSALTAHVFSTRHWPIGTSGGAEDGAGWDAVARAVDAGRLVRGRQVHGKGVLVATAAAGGRPDADIVVSAEPDVAVAVQVADCLPLLLVDRRLDVVAAAHAGWRGLAARVPAEAVNALGRSFGSDPGDILVAIGPSIGACCYQVGHEVFRAFVDEGFEAERLASYFLSAPVHSDRNPTLSALSGAPVADRWYFDQWRAARDDLVTAGVPAAQIYCAELCTASHAAVFCSFRRDGPACGRLAAAIRPARPRP